MLEIFIWVLIGFFLAHISYNTLPIFFLRTFILSLLGRTEFFDRQEFILNMKIPSTWANLGLWSPESSYPEAARNLALRLGEQCALKKGSRILDIGFGNGDQLQLWRQTFHASTVDAYNVSHSQTDYAQRTNIDENISIHRGSYQSLESSPQYDAIIALDCAYHFPSRREFFMFAKKHMAEQGQIALVDLSFRWSACNFWQGLLLKLIASASSIPHQNLWSKESYGEALNSSGFSEIQWTDISDQVFQPFEKFCHKHFEELAEFINPHLIYKYRLTSKFLSYFYKIGAIEMAIITANSEPK